VRDQYPRLSEFGVDGERLLQVISLLRAGEKSTYAEPSRSDLLSLPKDYMVSKWERAAAALDHAYEWAEHQGARPETLPNHGLLVAVAGYRSYVQDQNGSVLNDHEAVLRRWYFCKALQKGARQAVNYKIGQDFTELLAHTKTGRLPTFQRVELEWEDLMRLRKTEVRYKTIQCLMSTLITQDVVTGQKINNNTILEDHHIFPRAFAKAKGKAFEALADSIANRMVISRSGNRELGDKMPLEYFGNLVKLAKANGTVGDFVRRTECALIPGDPRREDWLSQFRPENFEKFCEVRSQLILDRVKEVVGDALVANSGSDKDET
jgi:hypothetical protein